MLAMPLTLQYDFRRSSRAAVRKPVLSEAPLSAPRVPHPFGFEVFFGVGSHHSSWWAPCSPTHHSVCREILSPFPCLLQLQRLACSQLFSGSVDRKNSRTK